MEKLSLWIRISSVTAVVSAIALSLISESKLKNTYKAICSLMVVFSLASAFSAFDINEIDFFDAEEDVSVSLKEKSRDVIFEEGKIFAETFISEKLKKAGFDLNCSAELYGEEDMLKIKNVTIYGELDDGEKTEIIRLINENAKEEIKVIFADAYNE